MEISIWFCIDPGVPSPGKDVEIFGSVNTTAIQVEPTHVTRECLCPIKCKGRAAAEYIHEDECYKEQKQTTAYR